MAHGYKGSKRLKRGRWHGIGAESQMLGLGTTVSAGLTVGPHTSKRAAPPVGPLGPGANSARCLLLADHPFSPISAGTTPILS